MHPLNSFFEKIFVISIPRNISRLNFFFQQTSGIQIELFQGIDGKELYPKIENVSQFPREFFYDAGIEYERASCWTKGQLGCAMSNHNLQKYIINSGIRSALILEDDSLILPQELSYFQRSLEELPEDWELFYLGYNNIGRWHDNNLLRLSRKIKYLFKPTAVEQKLSNVPGKMFLSKSYSKHLFTPGIYAGTHAYALSLEGAKKIVKLDTPLKFGFDTTLMEACYHKYVKAFALKKRLIIANPDFETTLIN